MIKFNLLDITAIIQATKNRQVVIYGYNEWTLKIKNKLLIAGIAKDIKFLCNDDEYLLYSNVKELIKIEEISLNKEYYYILLTESKEECKQSNRLIEIGLEYVKDFNYLENAHAQTKINQITALDPTMGHGTWSDNLYGCRFFGDYDKAKIKVAINGASLADETVFDWKIWPQLLYEKMVILGYDVAFAIHTSYGYTTSQCFLKFVRDIVPQRPDILIDYFVWENDCFYGKKIETPYVVGYQKKILHNLKGKINGRYENLKTNKFQLGRQIGEKTASVISKNVIFTKLLCDELGIEYICVLPPSIVSKKRNCLGDEEIYFSLGRKAMDVKDICDEAYILFIKKLKNSLMDARSWVDDYDAIFYDQFHMYEDGNEVIANNMLEIFNERYGKKGF